jgi:hypothetical protein
MRRVPDVYDCIWQRESERSKGYVVFVLPILYILYSLGHTSTDSLSPPHAPPSKKVRQLITHSAIVIILATLRDEEHLLRPLLHLSLWYLAT